ncbi:MAG: penicillin acylase family protein [Acidobacteriota bacterium]
MHDRIRSHRAPRCRLLFPVCLGVAVFLGAACSAPSSESDATMQSFEVPGLTEAATISVDRWGVPHIRANSEADLFFAQGFNAARDRLWQLDLWKRRGEGLLSEAFGPAFLSKDRAARLLLYRGDMYTEWLSYGAGTKRIVSSFAAGINAFIDLSEQQPDLLPPEFEELGYRPSRWTPESVVRIRSSGLVRNAASEARRARAMAVFGPEVLDVRDVLLPEHRAEVPEGLDLSVFAEDVLENYRLGTGAVDFEQLLRVARAGEPEDLTSRLASAELMRAEEVWQGSNNWAISPARSATGRPILADDPHRTVAVPSLRYLVHLTAPGLEVIGAGEPALPGISIGHNGTVAFGLTVFSIDQEDLYVYRTRDDGAYRYGDAWERPTVVRELVPVRGSDPEEIELRFTRHGPLLWQDDSGQAAVALRAAWLEPGMAPYLPGLELMRARDWQQFVDALDRWGAPSENQAYADVDGNIGWKPAGRWPVRPNWDGLLPVPGDGRYEWQGYRDMDALPFELNPERGFVATANENNLPEGFPLIAGYEWAADFRATRIREVLAESPAHSLSDSVVLQNDVVSLPARRILSALCGPALPADTPLCEWDGALDADSSNATLFETWLRSTLGPALLRRAAATAEMADALVSPDVRLTVRWVEEPVEAFGGTEAEAGQALAALARETLSSARQQLVERFGEDPENWAWGKVHRARLEHPLLERLGNRAAVPEVPRGGSGETVGNTVYRGASYDQLGGATFRMVLDVGEWDNSLANNAPGQSGVPGSEHYADLIEPWSRGEAFPLLYSQDRVDEATTLRIELRPVADP